MEKLERTVPIARQRALDLEMLADRKFVSRHSYLDKEQFRIEQEADLAAQRGRLREISAANGEKETQYIKIAFDSSMTAFGQSMHDLLESVLKNADTQAKLAAKIPGAKISFVGNISNTLQIGVGVGEGDFNIVGEALFNIIGGAIFGAPVAALGGMLLAGTGPVGLWIGRMGGAALGGYVGGELATKYLWKEINTSSGKNAILDLGLARIEFSLKELPRVLAPGEQSAISQSATVFRPVASPNDKTSIDIARQTADGHIEILGGKWRFTPDANAARSNLNYTVKKGESLWQLAMRDGVTVDAYLRANPQIKNPDLIREGQVINRPKLAAVHNDFDLGVKPKHQIAHEGAGGHHAHRSHRHATKRRRA